MSYSKTLLGLMVSAAIALIVVTNFCILLLLRHSGAGTADLLWAIAPMAGPSTVAIVLVMSTLYQSLQDVLSELDAKQKEATELAGRDVLTGLANKRLLTESIQQEIGKNRRRRHGFSVLMIDLDNFKRVNDVLGHQAGDEVLKLAAARLQSLVRQGDGLARFGGDEFLMLAHTENSAELRRLCKRIVKKMAEPYDIAGREACLPASIGAVYVTEQFSAAEEYVRAADVALYEAKAKGRNCFRFFTEELDAGLQRRDKLERDLRQCLATKEHIALHFQPQIDVQGQVVGAECLFRWHHPTLGMIPAIEAISIAEETKLIDALGEFVLREAAKFARAHPSLLVAINVSPAQFCNKAGVAGRFAKIVEQTGVRADQIELEVTEQLFMKSDSGCKAQLEELRELGFRLALDDFGTGYSSLSYLRRFKVDRLKLDRSFACEERAGESIALIRAAVTLAHAIGLDVVAEGIETDAQEAVALEAGCDLLQGNLYGRPMSLDAFESFLEHRSQIAA